MPDTPAIVGFVELNRGENEEVEAGLDTLPGGMDPAPRDSELA